MEIHLLDFFGNTWSQLTFFSPFQAFAKNNILWGSQFRSIFLENEEVSHGPAFDDCIKCTRKMYLVRRATLDSLNLRVDSAIWIISTQSATTHCNFMKTYNWLDNLIVTKEWKLL